MSTVRMPDEITPAESKPPVEEARSFQPQRVKVETTTHLRLEDA